MTQWRIVCDVGGTNLRYGLCDPLRQLSEIFVAPTKDCSSLEDSLLSYARRVSDREDVDGIAIGAAGPVEDGEVRLTNCELSISASAVRELFNGRPVRLLNDVEAVAWSLPRLSDPDLAPICEAANPLSGPRLVVNVGTGFGAAVLVRLSDGWHSIACEPGHMKLASGLVCPPATLLAETSIEEALSGLAMRKSLQFSKLFRLDLARMPDQADDLFSELASTAAGRNVIGNFSAIFGQVCGDLVLGCGAWGGVHLCGSVASAWCRHADKAAFRFAFEAKGPMSGRMKRVAVRQILAPYPALIGLCQVPLD